MFLRYFLTVILSLSISIAPGQTTDYVDPATDPAITPLLPLDGSYSLEFSDEFSDNSVNLEKWTINVSEKSRASRPKLEIDDWWWVEENVSETDGNLVLKVSKHDFNTMYCGGVNSNNKYEKRYGYYETRIKIADASKGTHTAFWLTGDHQGNIDGTGNDGAEVDIFESAWLEDYTKSVIHIDGYGAAHRANTRRYETPGLHEGYHTFGLLWTPEFLKIYYDGELKVTYTDIWVPQEEQKILLSDGASFGISGDYFTKLADGYLTSAYVDYIRVWRQEDIPPIYEESAYEAECETSKDIEWYYGNDASASNGFYAEVDPSITEPLQEVPLVGGNLQYTFTVDLAQEYFVWARMRNNSATSSDFWYRVNNRSFKQSNNELSQTGSWEWVLIGNDDVYFNQGENLLGIAVMDPHVQIDKLWYSSLPDPPSGEGASAVELCTPDLATNGLEPEVPPSDTLSLEAEKMTVLGNNTGVSYIYSCNTASENIIVNLYDDGGLVSDLFDMKSAGSHNLRITYLTANDRPAEVLVNGVSLGVITFPRSGKWCFGGGSTADLVIPVELMQAENEISILSTGDLGPHIDKITLERIFDQVEVNLAAPSIILTEGETLEFEILLAESLNYDQAVTFSVSGITANEYSFYEGNSLAILQGNTSALSSIEIIDDYEITGDRTFTLSIETVTNLLVRGASAELEITILENDTPIDLVISSSASELIEGNTLTITAEASEPVPVDQDISLLVSGIAAGDISFNTQLTIPRNNTSTTQTFEVLDNDLLNEYGEVTVSVAQTSSLMNILGGSISFLILDDEITTGVGIQLDKESYLAPVPARDFIRLYNFNRVPQTWQVYDVSGNRHSVSFSGQIGFNISSLRPGLYFLRVVADEMNICHFRFIKE